MLDMLFSGQAAWFGLPAALGTIFFVVRLVLLLAGGDGEMDPGMDAGVDAGFDVDVDADAVDGSHGDPGDAMRILSVQSAFAFMMGFGWGGFAGLYGFGLEWTWSLLCGAGVGAAAVWALARLLKLVHDLQSSGTVSIRDSIGAEGAVYVRVPASGEGRGQVALVIDERQRIVNAVSAAEELPRHARVRVTRVNDDNTITVVAAV